MDGIRNANLHIAPINSKKRSFTFFGDGSLPSLFFTLVCSAYDGTGGRLACGRLQLQGRVISVKIEQSSADHTFSARTFSFAILLYGIDEYLIKVKKYSSFL